MERRKFLSLISMALMAFALLFASSQETRAQDNPYCCFYTVDVADLRDHCFPFKILTYWTSGEAIEVIEKNGVYQFKAPQPCPESYFKCVTLDPAQGCVGIGQQGYFKLNDCCYEVTVKLDRKGCVVIYIRPCQ
jgi:hypothetical protein